MLFMVQLSFAQWAKMPIAPRWFYTDGKNLWAEYDGLYLFSDSSCSWVRTDVNLPSNFSASAIAADDTVLFLGGEWGGLYRSLDRGKHWSPCDSELTYNKIIGSITIQRNNVYAASVQGLYSSSDRGTSWQYHDFSTWPENCSVDAIIVTDSTICVSISIWYILDIQQRVRTEMYTQNQLLKGTKTNTTTIEDGVYYSTNTGKDWTLADYGNVSSFVMCDILYLVLVNQHFFIGQPMMENPGTSLRG